jgi:hypothetical protein
MGDLPGVADMLVVVFLPGVADMVVVVCLPGMADMLVVVCLPGCVYVCECVFRVAGGSVR